MVECGEDWSMGGGDMDDGREERKLRPCVVLDAQTGQGLRDTTPMVG